MIVITTSTNGITCVVDDVDSDLAAGKWSVIYPGRGIPYVQRWVPQGTTYSRYLHRAIVERMIGRALTRMDTVDHINGDTLDNRRTNLRLVTREQNAWNRRKASNNTSGYKGVCFNTQVGRWMAYIDYKGVKYRLGLFDTPELAHEAYKQEATRLYGEYARFE